MTAAKSVEDIVLLRGWLSQTPAAFQRDILDRCRLQAMGAGERLYAPGAPAGGIYGLVSGSLGITVAAQERGPYLAHLARPGDWFGEASLFTGGPRRVGLTALRETVVLHLPLQEVQAIVGRHPSAWRLFGLITIAHLDLCMGAFNDLAIRDPERRCVAAILRLGGVRNAGPAEAAPIDIDMTQDDLAVITSVARTTVNMVLRKLEKLGFLTLSYGHFSIIAPDQLRLLLED
jgi:CRP-like cAMP-binding protein